MIRKIQFAVLAAAIFIQASYAPAGAQQTQSAPPAKSQKLPRPEVLGKGATFERDPASGELHASAPDSTAPVDHGTIRSHVTLVQVAVTATAPDGTQVHGLTQDNFRIFEDGVAQDIASFDASATPASIALVLDASPSIYRELSEMRAAARTLAANLSPTDEISVVSFSAQAHVIMPFSADRNLLDRALDSDNLARVEDSSESNIYQSVFFAARELFQGRTGRRAIVLLTDGQDSGLGLSWDPASASPEYRTSASAKPNTKTAVAGLSFDDVARELGADGIALFIVSTENRPRAMSAEWLEAHRDEMLVSPEARNLGMPNYTLYLAELGRRVGGQLFFLREIGNLDEIYRRIALAINAQYTLGYYPSTGTSRPGWRALRVDLIDTSKNSNSKNSDADAKIPPGVRLTHRDSYYISAFQ